MELSEFVSQSLVAIAKAVQRADDELIEMRDCRVNPSGTKWEKGSDFGEQCTNSFRRVELIRFDVAVTVEGGTSTKGGIGVLGGIVNLGASGETDSKKQAVSKIQFTIPLMFPESLENRPPSPQFDTSGAHFVP